MTDRNDLDRLEEWAKGRGLRIRTDKATQREPTHTVSIQEASSMITPGPFILTRESGDSIDTAAFYLINTLSRLGVDVP